MRKPSSYAFIDFDDRRDAQDVICELDDNHNWRVEPSHYSRGSDDVAVVFIVLENLVVATTIIVLTLFLVIAGVQVSITTTIA